MRDSQTVLVPPSAEHRPKDSKQATQSSRTFAFDKSYWSFDRNDEHYAGQEDLFNDLGTPLLDNAFQGYNNCIFAYGQTGSGKSYSMMGYGGESGVIPRICKGMFDRIDDMTKDPNVQCTVEVSYLEIYNEKVRDLLNPATKGNLKVREHPSTGPYVEDLAKLAVRSFQEIENLMDEGNKARTVAATNMNETSSRSHAVFTLSLTQKRHDTETNMDMERAAKISLVDLAGSERATSTGATGARLKEGAEINKSLSTLGRVIAALADVSIGKKKNMSMVPYRDSILTWLLKDSLGGNSLTAMIAAISPADINYEETLSTLRYADSAKRIKNHAVVNEDANARMIRELKEELAQLRSKLASGSTDGNIDAQAIGALETQMVSITQSDGTIKQVSRAEIAEQLSQSEKLYQDLNQTWEQKLQKTETIHKEREAALEELGISIEKGFIGVSTPKKMPHLVNLSDDPLLAECLVYNLKPGATIVGNEESTNNAEIRLKGSKILKEHCTFQNNDGVVQVIPSEEAAVMVNGVRIDKPTRLRSGYRVILGDFHIFRFNHPLEARAERQEHEHGSKLKHSILPDQVENLPQSPSPHRRALSNLDQDSDSTTNSPRPKDDFDWSFARREAANAILGTDQKISALSDEDLDMLFDDLQRVRANRRGRVDFQDQDTDSESMTSFSFREKHASGLTTDRASLDTGLTAPSTSSTPDGQHPLSVAEVKAVQALKQEMERQMQMQREEYERQIAQLRTPLTVNDGKITALQKSRAKWAIEGWRQRRYVKIASLMLQNASTLKEAQVLAHQLRQTSVFQFAIVDAGQHLGSSYDMVLSGISDDDDDEELQMSAKPCLAVRVIDFRHTNILIWSLEKLHRRLCTMRQMQQYIERPEYLQHFRVDNPFSEHSLPQFSPIGDAQINLAAVFESRVQDFSVDVISPFTFSVVGILKISVEPALADAPESMLNFNAILHELTGFEEIEGNNIHAQFSVPRVSEDGGITTSQLISGFGSGPVHFQSLHGMSLPSSSPRNSKLRIALFAQIKPTHLDKLLSWDDMREGPVKHDSTRLAETEFQTGDRHDVFVQAKVLELSETGDYEPSEAVLTDGEIIFQVHQGLQRRILVNMTHTCGESLPWTTIRDVKVGSIQLVDANGRAPEANSSHADVNLQLLQPPTIADNADGTTSVKISSQWDSGGNILLDRVTSEKHRIRVPLSWTVVSEILDQPLRFTLNLSVQIRPRSHVRQQSLFSQLWTSESPLRSASGIFVVNVKPVPIKNAADLWRLETKYDYVKGEESLAGWTPRGISLIRDYMDNKLRQRRVNDVEIVASMFGKYRLAVDGDRPKELSQSQFKTLRKCVAAWQSAALHRSHGMLETTHFEGPQNGPASASPSISKRLHSASALFQPKNPILLKSGELLAPNETQTRWIKRHLELRLPYLHIHSVPEADEINAINLNNARIDHEPNVAKLLQRPGTSSATLHIFAIYAHNNTLLFASRSERERLEWVFKIDEALSGPGGSLG